MHVDDLQSSKARSKRATEAEKDAVTTTYPSAPPMRATAPASSPSPRDVSTASTATPLDINGIASTIAASDDPAALLTHLLLAVSSRAATAPEQGALLSKVSDGCADMLRRVRSVLLASVGEQPGAYNGFEVFTRAGSRRVNYERLQKEYPEAFNDVVTVGSPTTVVRYAASD